MGNRYYPRDNAAVTEPPTIYAALGSLVATQRDLVTMLGRSLDEMERREEELRDAHLDLANALHRRMDSLHRRMDSLHSRIDAQGVDVQQHSDQLAYMERRLAVGRRPGDTQERPDAEV